MFLLVLLTYARYVVGQVGPIPDLPNEIVFSISYRDFLPTTCSYIAPANPTLTNKQQEIWDKTIPPQRRFTCELYDNNIFGENTAGAAAARILIDQELIIGHPDFEALDQSSEVTICNKGQNFPVGSCAFALGEDGFFNNTIELSIVKPELEIGHNGLPKPLYCSDVNGGETRCGFVENKGQTQTQKQFFDVWYNDDLRFNKRIGQNLVLRADPNNEGTFFFDSNQQIDDPDTGTDLSTEHFGPLGRFKFGEGALLAAEVTDIIDAPAWPRTMIDAEVLQGRTLNKSYYFTTELHSTFEFRRDESMVFSFEGDDDFWAYINNKLVIDLGGLHSPEAATIDLNDENITIEGQSLQQFLGLVDGEIATLDIFHAERQTSESNFLVTSTLFPACNVLLSGTETSSFVQQDVLASLKLSNSASFNANNGELVLQESGKPFSSGFFFTANQENVGRGFQAKFDIKISGLTEGFAFVVQAEGVDDFPVLSGSSFGITGLTRSFAVVFDFCANRNEVSQIEDCALQSVSVHHANASTEENSFSTETRRTFDFIARNLARDEYFPVEIVHFGGRPNFLEVYVNESLYLRENDFNLEDILGGIGAHVGMTATSSDVSADVTVRNFALKTVEVNPFSSRLLVTELEAPEEIVADGVSTTEGVPIVTSDACDVQLESGTLEEIFDARFIQVLGNESGRVLQEVEAHIEPALIRDNDDGSYDIQLRTEIPGSYRLVIAFGAGCSIGQNNQTGEFFLQLADGVSETDCFFEDNFNNGNVVAIAEPVDDTVNTDDVEDSSGNDVPIVEISVVSSLCFLCLLLVLIMFMRKRRKWNKEKAYVPPGELFKTEMETKFDPQNEYNETGRAVLQTQKEILELQTHQELNSRHKEIVTLQSENNTLKQMLRKNRAEAEENEDAEDAREAFDEEINAKDTAAKKVGRTEF